MKRKNWMLVNGRPRCIKPELTVAYMQSKYPDKTIVACCAPPSEATMNRWVDDCVAKATDGCRVEPDGICVHGHQSWLSVLGYI